MSHFDFRFWILDFGLGRRVKVILGERVAYERAIGYKYLEKWIAELP
ncbi:hypothetical protein QUB70_21760 [Microcoleus sp. A003_D6]